jgi:hypothetical protein
MIFLLALETKAMSVTQVEHFSISDYALVRLGLEWSSSTTSHGYSGTESVAVKLERC